MARARRRRGERRRRTTTGSSSRRSREYLPHQPTDGLVTVARRAAFGRAREPAHGRRIEPRRRAPRVRGGRAFARAARRAAERAVPRRRPLSRTRSPTSRWRNLVCNSAHDSSCACSVDEVVDQVLVRYDEARQIGDGLTRDAVHALAAQVDAAARRDRRGEPDRTRAHRARRGHAARAAVRCTWSTPTAAPRPAQIVGEISGEAFATMVTGQKVRWVLDLMRGTEFAGRDDHARTRSDRRPRRRRTRSCCTRPARATRRATSRSSASGSSSSGRRGSTISLRLLAAPLRRVLFDTGAIAGFGWSCFTSVDAVAGADEPAGDGRRRRRRARQRAPARRSRPDDRHLHDRRLDGGRASRGSAASSTAATAATPTTTRRPPTTASSTRPTRCASRRSSAARCARGCAIEADYTWPAHAHRRRPLVLVRAATRRCR